MTCPVVISASRRTDIPAYYARWFLRRLEEGFCEVRHPFGTRALPPAHGREAAPGLRGAASPEAAAKGRPRSGLGRAQSCAPIRVSLFPEDVAAIVFWTRNPRPLLPHLPEIWKRGYRFYFQFTLLGYPRALDRHVPAPERAADCFDTIAGEYGPDAVNWRYDPIVLTTLTPEEYHLRAFGRLARRLEGRTRRAIVSFVDLYRKTLRNLRRAAFLAGFTFEEPCAERRKALVDRLAEIAAAHGMRLEVCCEDALVGGRVEKAHCVDLAQLRAVAGARVPELAIRPTRPECGCYASMDVGSYDSCLHGCAYCYAVSDPGRAIARFAAWDPSFPHLP